MGANYAVTVSRDSFNACKLAHEVHLFWLFPWCDSVLARSVHREKLLIRSIVKPSFNRMDKSDRIIISKELIYSVTSRMTRPGESCTQKVIDIFILAAPSTQTRSPMLTGTRRHVATRRCAGPNMPADVISQSTWSLESVVTQMTAD